MEVLRKDYSRSSESRLSFHYIYIYIIAGKGRPVMDWGIRLKLAIGAAKGLAYLHEACKSSATLQFSQWFL